MERDISCSSDDLSTCRSTFMNDSDLPIQNKRIKRKLIAFDRGPLGSNVIKTTYEELEDVEKIHCPSEFSLKKNPNKRSMVKVSNRFDDKLEICHYKGNNFVNIFISGGVHQSRFVFSLSNIKQLINELSELLAKLSSEQ